MDVNGTRYHLLLGRDDWQRCVDPDRRVLGDRLTASRLPCADGDFGFGWDPRRSELTLRPCLDTFRARPGDRPPSIGNRNDTAARCDRRGAAADVFGNLYWIGERRTEVRVLSSGTGQSARFWPPETNDESRRRYGEFGAVQPRPETRASLLGGLAVTDDHYLVIGTIAPAGLLVFDLHAGGDPQRLLWPSDSFAPFDISARPGGGIWVLDRSNARVWALDRHFGVVRVGSGADAVGPREVSDELFQPASPGAERRRIGQLSTSSLLDAALSLDAQDPVSIEALGTDGFMVLDRVSPAGSRLIVRRPERGTAAAVSLAPFALAGYDMAFVPATDGPSLGHLHVVSDGGNQTFEIDVTETASGVSLALVPSYRPMRLFGGKGILVTRDGRPFYDVGDTWVPLEPQAQPRYATRGTLVTPPLDGKEPECVWHRVLLDAVIPPATSVLVETRASDEARALDVQPWQREPPPYLRGDGSEQPFANGATDRTRGAGTWELLIQRARGQYLQVRLTLTGDGRRSPRVRAMRIHYPRFSYLPHYLPAVYREEPTSASFLDRFLANMEGIHTTIEERVAAAQLLFDAEGAPAETLDWLARWFGVALDPAWDEARRRLFIRHAMDFFQWRGTARGLLMAAGLAVAEQPAESLFADSTCTRSRGIRIVERYRTRRTPPVVLGDPAMAVGPREVRPTARWQPAEGRQTLNARYASATALGSAEFPLVSPTGPAADVWRRFASETLGFVPAAAHTNPTRWQEFLARRYQRGSALAAAYGIPAAVEFADIAPPTVLPNDGAPLLDWFEFERTVLPMRQLAHRFTVMLPMRAGTPDSEQRTRLTHVRRVIDLERPAHTVFDVKFYWALFRVGEARLGQDTLIERGGRAPELMRPATLGQTHLAESYVAPAPPFDATDRRIVDRDRIDGPTLLGGMS